MQRESAADNTRVGAITAPNNCKAGSEDSPAKLQQHLQKGLVGRNVNLAYRSRQLKIKLKEFMI
jgi:hypothetical protein